MKRNRIIYFCLIIFTMFLGLISRKYGNYLPEFLKLYLGDTLWALMVYFGISFIVRKGSIKTSAITALSFSWAIEFSQLYKAEWILSVRATKIGALILGHGFLVSDLVCYSVGVMIGVLIEKIIYYKK